MRLVRTPLITMSLLDFMIRWRSIQPQRLTFFIVESQHIEVFEFYRSLMQRFWFLWMNGSFPLRFRHFCRIYFKFRVVNWLKYILQMISSGNMPLFVYRHCWRYLSSRRISGRSSSLLLSHLLCYGNYRIVGVISRSSEFGSPYRLF